MKRGNGTLFIKGQNLKEVLLLNFFLFNLDLKEENTNLTPNQILNIPKLKAKHKRLFRKLKVLKEKNLISEYSGINYKNHSNS